VLVAAWLFGYGEEAVSDWMTTWVAFLARMCLLMRLYDFYRRTSDANSTERFVTMSPDTGPDVGILVRLDMARPLYFTPLSVIRNNTSINDYELTGEFFRSTTAFEYTRR